MITAAVAGVLVDERQNRLFAATVAIYGKDVETILNGLQEMTARIAIMAGVEPEKFAGGMKAHWDYLACAVNAATEQEKSQ
jgi:ribosomal protein L12E/L44/L45/RPP1/RPP2